MPFSIRPSFCFPVQCAGTSNAGPFLKLSLDYVVGFTLLTTLIALSNGPAYAEWVAASNSDEEGMTVNVDPGTLRRNGDMVKIMRGSSTRL
jgi:hypothetical protein